MCEKNFAFWCCALLLLVSSSSKSQENSTNNEEKDDNLTVRYELDMNSTTNYGDEIKTLRFDLYEKFTNNTQYDKMQYESRTTSTSNNREDDDSIQYKLGKHSIQNHEDDEQILMKSRANSTNVNHKRNFTSQEVYGNSIENNGSMSQNSNEDSNKSRITLIYDVKIIFVSFHTASMLLLVSIFLVYSILPELRNVHGFMLRNYSGALCVSYIIDIMRIIMITNAVQDSDVYVTIGFFGYFCFFASFFWLNVMSFDMWWTFRVFCSLQRNVNQRQRKKLLFYVIYAWGIPFILAIVYIIMGFVPGVSIIFRPQFRTYWIGRNIVAFILYYHGLMSFCTIISLCLSISTALKIARYKRDTDHRLQDSESRRYNDNKKWFNLYLKLFILLFIVIGIKWFIITALLSENASLYDSFYNYAIHLTNFMQNLCTFIIYVWQKKIKRMLLKRFGCGLFPETRCGINATSSSTSTSTSGIAMQEKMSSCRQAQCHVKTISDSTDL